MSDTAVEVDGLQKAFGTVLALDGLSFRVPAGSVLGLLGPNGSGKTTTVSILSTALRPDAGRAIIGGLDVVADAARVRRVIGFAGQFAAVDPNLTGRENLTLIGRLSRLGRAQARVRAGELLGSFGLTAAADRLVRTYSGGMRRRLDLAAALLHRPPVLFLDEPTTGLDPESRFALWESVRDLSLSGTTVLLTTQYLEEADTLADRSSSSPPGKWQAAGRRPSSRRSMARCASTSATPGHRSRRPHLRVAAGGYQPDRDSAGVRVRSAAGSAALTGVLRALEGQAPNPVSVAVREPTLDDVFRSLIEGEG